MIKPTFFSAVTTVALTALIVNLIACGGGNDSTVSATSATRDQTRSKLASTTADFAGSTFNGLAGKCLAILSDRQSPGTPVQLYGCNGTDAQQWSFDGAYVKSKSGLCLDVSGAQTANGSDIIVYTCHFGQNQQWSLVKGQLKSAASGKCLDVYASQTSDGARVTLWDCNGGANQQWSYTNPATPNPATSYYVAINGSDSNPGTLELPFKTIQRAADIATPGTTVYLRAGTYRETVTPANSGSIQNPIVFQNYNGEIVTISGADIVAGPWIQTEGNKFYASMKWDMGAENQVFENGQMLYLARYPNKTDTDLYSTNGAKYMDNGSPTSVTESSLSGDPDYWKGGILWMLNGSKWTTYGAKITASYKDTVTFSDPGFWDNNHPQDSAGTTGNLFYISGLLSLLDYPNEWFYEIASARLFVYGDPSNKVIEAKRRLYSFDLNNRSFISIKGLSTFASTIRIIGNNNTLDGVFAKYLYHRTAEGMSYTFPGDNPAKNGDGVYIEGNYNIIANSKFYYAAGNGIAGVGGKENKIDNNEILYTNYIGNYDAAISYFESTNNYITRNKTWYCGGPCITVSGGVNDYNGNFVLYNDVAFAEQLGDDRGGINGDGSVIAYNWIHNIGNGWATGFTPGMYSDDLSNYAKWHHNVIYNNIGVDGAGRNGGVGKFRGTVKFYNNTGFNLPSSEHIRLHVGGVSGVHDSMNPEMANSYHNQAAVNFIDAAAGNFNLAPSASAIDVGVIIPGITDGYVNAPDLGAYEYGADNASFNWKAGTGVKMYYLPEPVYPPNDAISGLHQMIPQIFPSLSGMVQNRGVLVKTRRADTSPNISR